MKTKWIVLSRNRCNYSEEANALGVSEVIVRIMRNRNIVERKDEEAYLNGTVNDLYDGSVMADMVPLADKLKEKIDSAAHIRIMGDYDVDGVCSSYILLSSLKKLGANVSCVIPDRHKDGYGLNSRLIKEAKDAGVDTIITCDNGISAIKEIEEANALGMTVLVTDHHAIPFHMEGEERIEDLPDAYAVVNPHRSDCPYPYKELCGAGVALKAMEYLYSLYKREWDKNSDLYEVAALATNCDVMPLTGENRIIVRHGLKLMRNSSNKGLKELIELSSISGIELNTFHLGFVLGPCINAAGRLETADLALDLLMSTNEAEVSKLAHKLKELNDSRKSLTQKAVDRACEIAESESYVNQMVLVIKLDDCHESIAGLVAGRLKEKYKKPTIVFTDALSSEGDRILKGSGRSVDSYDIHFALTEVSELLLIFGGHKKAAGLSIEPDRFEELREALNKNCKLTEDNLIETVYCEAILNFKYVSEKLAESLKAIEPFGEENKQPLFCVDKVTIKNIKIFGADKNVFKGEADDGTGKINVKFFGEAEAFERFIKEHNGHIKLCYSPGINEFNGYRNLELTVKYYDC
ncbi:MAG: single-stranded-DNA-specific exonuclease RecJ [Lachnospiraceae bacterium]|nr:single-stranded-DNA-specific exonuclease RecJ [Lachnospiraceae bacterium]